MDKALTVASCLAMGICIVLMLVVSFLGIAENLAKEPLEERTWNCLSETPRTA